MPTDISKRTRRPNSGNRPTDASELLQRWYWYTVVRNIEGLSDSELNEKFFTFKGSDRLFDRIAAEGRKPPGVRKDRPISNFILDVARHENYEISLVVWTSALWDIVSIRPLPRSALNSLAMALCEKAGLVRLKGDSIKRAIPRSTTITSSSTHLSKELWKIAVRASLEDLALLCALYLVAVAYKRRTDMDYLRWTIAIACLHICRRNRMNLPMASLFTETIALRVISRHRHPNDRLTLPKDWSPFTSKDSACISIQAARTRAVSGRANNSIPENTDALATLFDVFEWGEATPLQREARSLVRNANSAAEVHEFVSRYVHRKRRLSDLSAPLVELFDTHAWAY